MREIKVNIQIKLFVPRWRERSFDDLCGLTCAAVAVNSDEREWVWEPKYVSIDKLISRYNCLKVIWVRWEVPRGNLRWYERWLTSYFDLAGAMRRLENISSQ